MLPGDRLICALLEPKPVGHRFENWPLHVTIIPWFRLETDTEQVAAGLQEAFRTVRPFSVHAEGEMRLGPARNRPARLLDPGPYLSLERLSRRYLHKKRAWLVDETTKKRRAYLPHVTQQGDERLEEGDTVRCDRLYIIEQKGDYKEVAAEIRLA